jgi:hypothetical protein
LDPKFCKPNFFLDVNSTLNYTEKLILPGIHTVRGTSLRPSVERTRDSSNLIGEEQFKFVCSAFTEFVRSRRVWVSINIADKFSSTGQTFLSKLIQSLQFIYFNELLPYPLEGSLSKVLSTPQP